jgi:hypothetical protein
MKYLLSDQLGAWSRFKKLTSFQRIALQTTDIPQSLSDSEGGGVFPQEYPPMQPEKWVQLWGYHMLRLVHSGRQINELTRARTVASPVLKSGRRNHTSRERKKGGPPGVFIGRRAASFSGAKPKCRHCRSIGRNNSNRISRQETNVSRPSLEISACLRWHRRVATCAWLCFWHERGEIVGAGIMLHSL